MRFSIVLITAFSLFITGCDDFSRENLLQSLRAKNYIESANLVVNRILQIPYEYAQEHFRLITTNGEPQNARVIFLGEIHDDERNRLFINVILEKLIEPGDAILLEGDQAGLQTNCAAIQINGILSALHWRSTLVPYQPELFSGQFGKAIRQWELHKEQVKVSKLKISRIPCIFWDNSKALQEKELGNLEPLKEKAESDPLVRRNKSMAATIAYLYPRFKRLFVIAGYGHIPSAELIETAAHDRQEGKIYHNPAIFSTRYLLHTLQKVTYAAFIPNDLWGKLPTKKRGNSTDTADKAVGTEESEDDENASF